METNESISSIIKERIDAFEFKENIEPIEPELLHKRGIFIDCGSEPHMLQAEIYNAIAAAGLPAQMPVLTAESVMIGGYPVMQLKSAQCRMKDLVFEQLELKTICFPAKKNHPYGWYQKFNRKSRWQK